LPTFPSWKPNRSLDHILVSSSIEVENVEVLNVNFSDHLPISMDVMIPDAIRLRGI
jgi:endonuclease/exonuclease/phosphatase family metal-dependent hydrolase